MRDSFSEIYARLIDEGKDPQSASRDAADQARTGIGHALAADASLGEARRRQALSSPLLDQTSMTAAEHQTYLEHFAAAHAGAHDEVAGRVTRELSRQTEAWWKDESTRVRKQIEAEINDHPANDARAEVKRGVHPDLLAERFGFDTGAELLQAIESLDARRKDIKGETERRMLAEHGDMLSDQAIADRALEAVHNDRQA